MEKTTGIIVLGTSSDAGKSFISTALCRLLVNDNLTVAPFKSLNMTSDVVQLADGRFIGKSTFEQAVAAKVTPSVTMNPILLQQANTGLQVSLLGNVINNVHSIDFRSEYYNKGIYTIQQAIEQLKSDYEVIIFEGSGSPVEINLKDRELVNMKVAELADVPALLVADIDRGGVFASIVGTIELLPESERNRIQGIIINKFRGNPDLFADGIQIIEEKTQIPVIGVIPFMDDQAQQGDKFENKANFVKQHINFTKLKNIIFQWGNE